jgi:hypothetical protein
MADMMAFLLEFKLKGANVGLRVPYVLQKKCFL